MTNDATPSTPGGSQPPATPFTVGIGASAGGLEAIEAFFQYMPPDSGCAFVVVQHLSPDHKSMMAELLSKRTSMPVQEASDGVQILANHVYLIPPRQLLVIEHGHLRLHDRSPLPAVNLPIDIFFESLAGDATSQCAGIILSGTGSDGSRGLRSIKEHGGLIIAQEIESAKFDGMPRSAIATGLVDLILKPGAIPEHLVNYLHTRTIVQLPTVEQGAIPRNGLQSIFAHLHERTGVDFGCYKPNTVLRRIERRMAINQIDEVRAYTDLLAVRPNEIDTLYREMLIGVTSFFRDPEVFQEFAEEYLEALLDRCTDRDLRIWVAGCSTGEEAYTIAMLVREHLERTGDLREVKVFATDLDRNAILTAQTGIYSEAIVADLPEPMLQKYFHRCDGGYQIARSLRELVIFAKHNLLRDPPFTHVHCISCRNLLIYIRPEQQREVIANFNFALVSGGLMILGTSESINETSDGFDTLSSRSKIFQSQGRSNPSNRISNTDQIRRLPNPGPRPSQFNREFRLLQRFLEVNAGTTLPVTILVDEQLHIVQIMGDTSPYLKLQSGSPSNDLSRLAQPELALPLATGVQKVLRSGNPVRYTAIRLTEQTCDLDIRPLTIHHPREILASVSFIPHLENTTATPTTAVREPSDAEQRDHIDDLEQELQYTRETLQATIEELETSNEELQATNEELLSSNEELQSTNEELQSTNEELHTVNTQYQAKIIELSEATADIDNLLTNTKIGVMILDEELNIRRFSPAIGKLFGILEGDIGRPITHLRHRLLDIDPVSLSRQVIHRNRQIEREVCSRDGNWYLMRLAPYRLHNAHEHHGHGVVLSFVETTNLRQTEEALAAAEANLSELLQLSAFGVLHIDGTGRILDSNPRGLAIFGIEAESISEHNLFSPHWHFCDTVGMPLTDENNPILRSLRHQESVRRALIGFQRTNDNQPHWIEISTNAIEQDNTTPQCLVLIADINEAQRRLATRQQTLERVDEACCESRQIWWQWYSENRHIEYLLGDPAWLNPEPLTDETQFDWRERIHEGDRERFAAAWHVLASGSNLIALDHLHLLDDHGEAALCHGHALVIERDSNGLPSSIVGLIGQHMPLPQPSPSPDDVVTGGRTP
mgnify:CR=1 FL=1